MDEAGAGVCLEDAVETHALSSLFPDFLDLDCLGLTRWICGLLMYTL
jgi:hypothetical protein